MAEFKLEGYEEVIQALKDLDPKVQIKIIQSFLRKAGSKYVVDNLKSVLPWASQKKFIKVSTNSQEPLAIYAGPTSGGYKLRWLDKGTKERKTKKGWNRGALKVRNIIEPTIDAQIEPIIDYFNTEFGNEINKIVERRVKRINKANL